MVTAHEAGNLLVPVLVEGASWGQHGARRFPDVSIDVPEVMTPAEGLVIKPRAAITAMFEQVAVDLSRTYFDAFMDQLESRVRKHLPATRTVASSQLARLSVAPGLPGAGQPMAGAASGADAFWYTSFGDEREAVPWAEFEAKLRTSMVTSDGAWEVALPTLKSAIETTGGEVKFATFRASFSTSDASFAETLKSMAETVESKETIFDITLRDASTKEVDERLDPTFIMVKLTATLSTVRSGIMDCFNEDDEEDLGDLAFLQGGDFAFVFKNGERWVKVRRSQEKSLKRGDLEELSIIPDTKGKRKAASEPEPEEEASVGASSNPNRDAATAILAQARTRQMEQMTAADVLADPALATQFNRMLTSAGGNEDTTTMIQLLSALQQNPNSAMAKQSIQQQFLSESTPMQVAGLSADAKSALSTALSGTDQASLEAQVQASVARTEKELAKEMAQFKQTMFAPVHGKKVAASGGDDQAKATVVVIGGGAGGGLAALALDRNPKLHVVLIDTKEYFEETPAVPRMMVEEDYEVFDAAHVEHKEYIVNGEVVVGRATAVTEEHVRVASRVIKFDYLIVATGTRYPSEIKTSNTSLEFRRKQMKTERQRIQAASKVVMIGGGLVGTELAGDVRAFFPDKEIEIVTRNTKLLPRMEGAHELAVGVLGQSPGAVKVRTEETVSFELDVNENCFLTSKDETIALDGTRVYNCTGYKPNNSMLPKEWLDEEGFLRAEATQTVPGVAKRNVFAVGDICEKSRHVDGERLSASAATHGMAAYKNIERLVEAGWTGIGDRPKLLKANLEKGNPTGKPSAFISLGKEKMVRCFLCPR